MNDAPRAALDLKQARLLVEMAEIALRDRTGEVSLPDGWDVVQSFRADGGAIPRARGFYAAGSLGSGAPRVAVLALALPWLEYLDWTLNRDGRVELDAPPAGVAAGAPADARFDKVLGAAYSLLRAPLWKHLAQALAEGRGTLWITAKNLGSPLAHLAALDLRPGNTGPNRETAPTAAPPCWTFSSPAAGNAAFKTFADAKGGAVTNVWAGTAAVPVDFFPTAPAEAQGYALPGTLEPVATSIPELDEPWTERGGPFYLTALKGSPDGIATPGQLVDPPAGFEPIRAHTLARLSLVAYQRRQHPARGIIDVAPYQIKEDLAVGGVPWCALFESPSEVVAAFRGTVTSDELARITADSAVANASFVAPRDARVHAGTLRLYTASTTTAPDGPAFRAVLQQKLRALAGTTKPIYLAGHDLGGALAALAAIDLRTTASDLKVTKVYAYGSTPLGDFDFALRYKAKLETSSYLVMRDLDFARRLQLASAYDPLPQTVLLRGAPVDDDASRHSLASYITLLDEAARPGQAFVPEAAGAGRPEPPLTGREQAWMDARLAALGVVQPPRSDPAAPVADADGRIVLSTLGPSALPPLAPQHGGAPVFAAPVLRVEAADALVARAGEDGAPRLVVGRLVLGAGARVSLPAGSELHAARAELDDGVSFRLVGKDGADGATGKDGKPGYFELYGQHIDGFPGEPGQPGQPGDPGGGGLFLGSVEGTVTVFAGGGRGGAGGQGGRGGDGWPGVDGAPRGGDGGPGFDGKPGGNGGPGGTTIVEVAMQPGAALQLIALGSQGGAGGGGGKGGTGGPKGNHHGKDGKPGNKGDDGAPGDLPVFSVRYHDE